MQENAGHRTLGPAEWCGRERRRWGACMEKRRAENEAKMKMKMKMKKLPFLVKRGSRKEE
jgi:hypothetical protein